ncbi:hypothetical protein B7494_g6291 [Chlorociboria aeruginascens]|nr:hypothetical protein B7494_g6291 [Chlorociboria aeruginascens]
MEINNLDREITISPRPTTKRALSLPLSSTIISTSLTTMKANKETHSISISSQLPSDPSPVASTSSTTTMESGNQGHEITKAVKPIGKLDLTLQSLSTPIMEPENQNGNFKFFPKLAAEIQLRIWFFALGDEEQVLKLGLTKGAYPSQIALADGTVKERPATRLLTVDYDLPALLRVCSDSRSVALKHYVPSFDHYFGRPIYINFAAAIFTVSDPSHDGLLTLRELTDISSEEVFERERRSLRKLAICRLDRRFLTDMPRIYERLERLILPVGHLWSREVLIDHVVFFFERRRALWEKECPPEVAKHVKPTKVIQLGDAEWEEKYGFGMLKSYLERGGSH